MAVLFLVAALAVGLRFYVRLFMTRTVTAEDWLLLLTQVVITAGCTLVVFVEAKKHDYAPRSPELFAHMSTVCHIRIESTLALTAGPSTT